MRKNKTLKSDNIHAVWDEYCKKFMTQRFPTKWKCVGYDLMVRIRRWAINHPSAVHVIKCDDAVHATSLLVYIDHNTSKRWMGTTVVFVPQRTGEQPSIHFLYPNNLRNVRAMLKMISIKSRCLKGGRS